VESDDIARQLFDRIDVDGSVCRRLTLTLILILIPN
jgi:hypothetical protein